ncbi:MAG: hypothetical protein JST04_10455 [Bdellovibrionales bacterium]|nr:hypothetical protein [Bdellovibrionales bacterium]
MAKEKDGWARFRERENERVEEERSRLQEEMRKIDPKVKLGETTTTDQVLIELLTKCEVMMEQITNLYGMWIQGLERTPPTVQRKHLEDLILKIQAAPKPTANLRFRVNEFHTKYNTYKDKWDRLLKDVEAGKVVVKRKSVSGS